MVFCLLHGSGKKFGPFFHSKDEHINQHTYHHLLAYKVFPIIKRSLGLEGFGTTIWQQDGAKPHQANLNMDYLDSVFGARMLALKARQGDSWAPTSPDLNPCDFFLWGYLKEKVYKPVPANMAELKQRIKNEFTAIPEFIVRKSVLAMRDRCKKVIKVNGGTFEGELIKS